MKPTLDPAGNAGQPILLARQLRPAPGGTRLFRGSELDSRPPQSRGSILSIDERLPIVDLGSLDGLVKGHELRVFRDGQPVGRIMVTTIFREAPVILSGDPGPLPPALFQR